MDIKWEFKASFSMTTEHILVYRSAVNGRGVQMEINTPCSEDGEFGEGKTHFFIDGDDREFASQEEMLSALEDD